MKYYINSFASSEDLVVFGGGMPRASYSDRHTVTIMKGDKHVVFDFTSRVIDFVTIMPADEALTGTKYW
jgi:lethal(2) giant larvae protein